MRSSQRIRQVLNRYQRKPITQQGILGNVAGEISVPNRVDNVYVRVAGLGTISVYNKRVPLILDLPVDVGYDPLEPKNFQVLGIHRYPQGGGRRLVDVSTILHGSTHNWAGIDPVFIEKRQLMPLRPTPMGGMNVYITREITYYDNDFVAVTGQQMNLAPYIPATGSLLVLLYKDIDEIIKIQTGGTLRDVRTLSLSDAPQAYPGTVPIALIRLYGGQSGIAEGPNDTDLIDVRPLFSPIATTGTGGAGGGHVIQDEGVSRTQRTNLNFKGSLVWAVDNAGNDSTDIIISGTSSGISTGTALANHDHSGDAGDGGKFPLINLLSTGATLNQVPLADGSGGITWGVSGEKIQIDHIHIDGRLGVLSDVGGSVVITGDSTLEYIYITCKTKGTSGSTIVDVNRNGLSIFYLNTANRPTLAYNDADSVAKSGIPDIVYLDENDLLTFDIDQKAVGAETLDIFVVRKLVEDVQEMTYGRYTLIDNIWSGNGLPTAGANSIASSVSDPLSSSPANLLRVDKLTISMDNNAGGHVMDSTPYIWYPTLVTSNGKMAIVHQGHTAAIDSIGVGDTIRALVEDGFTVAGFLMPANGDVATHNGYPAPNGTLNYLKFFVEPVIRTINEFVGSFSDFYMVGLSGGGWTTVICAAIDARISISVQVSGSLPLECTTPRDWEQYLPGVADTEYEDLYVMGADKPGRRQVQSLTVNDACCFTQADYNEGPDYAGSVSGTALALGGSFALVWDSTHTIHEISAATLAVIEDEFGY